MEVNKDKTKNHGIQKGGDFWLSMKKWFYNDTRLEVVNNYCYLGFNFTTKLSCKQRYRPLSRQKGKKAVICLSKAFQKYKEMTYETFFKIFDSKSAAQFYYIRLKTWGTTKT